MSVSTYEFNRQTTIEYLNREMKNVIPEEGTYNYYFLENSMIESICFYTNLNEKYGQKLFNVFTSVNVDAAIKLLEDIDNQLISEYGITKGKEKHDVIRELIRWSCYDHGNSEVQAKKRSFFRLKKEPRYFIKFSENHLNQWDSSISYKITEKKQPKATKKDTSLYSDFEQNLINLISSFTTVDDRAATFIFNVLRYPDKNEAMHLLSILDDSLISQYGITEANKKHRLIFEYMNASKRYTSDQLLSWDSEFQTKKTRNAIIK